MSDTFPDPHPVSPGRDITRAARHHNAPVVILVEPQMAENIGTAARAMANFGLGELRLVAPRDGWPNAKAYPPASGANRILDEARVYPDLAAAIADLTRVYATTARAHDQIKPVLGPSDAVRELRPLAAAGQRTGVVFGRERNGLLNGEVALCDAILTYPVNPEFSSLNLAQAVLVLGFAWHGAVTAEAVPMLAAGQGAAAPKGQMVAFFAMLEAALDRHEFFRPPEKRDTMVINLRNIITRMAPTAQELATLHGVITTLAEGAKGPATGGPASPETARAVREALAAVAAGEASLGRAPARGLARLMRRNATGAEKTLWLAMMKDRRFAGRGFARAVPIGPHVADMVAMPIRLVIDLVPVEDDAGAAQARALRREWLVARDYRVVEVRLGAIEADLAGTLDGLAAAMG